MILGLGADSYKNFLYFLSAKTAFTQGVSFIVFPRTAVLSHRKPASAETSSDMLMVSDKRDTVWLQFEPVSIPVHLEVSSIFGI